MARFTESRSLVKGRVRFYEKTPAVVAVQRALIAKHYTPCRRIALTTCADPRVDTDCVVEDAYARLCADWVRQEHRAVESLRELVRIYAREALKRVPDSWIGRDWTDHEYAVIFADVADTEVTKALHVIDAMPESMKRIFEARRIFAYPMALTASRLGVSINSVGTTKADDRIRAVTDLRAVTKFFAEQMEGGS
ncbi:RNA polymerase sigma factor [Streptomyces sp. DB-54]